RIVAPGTVESGDTVWIDKQTLAVGRGVRTNQAGIDQLQEILKPLGKWSRRFVSGRAGRSLAALMVRPEAG
ncbi:MAG: hypothetical protein EOP21_08460, partial [Hyphomicrobiales bacterium]